MNIVIIYLSIGLWTYICLMSYQWDKVYRAKVMMLIAGFFTTIILWPIAPFVVTYVNLIED